MKLHLPKLLLTAVMAAVVCSQYALAAVEGPGSYTAGTLPALTKDASVTLNATDGDVVWDASGLTVSGVTFDINAASHDVKLLAPVNSNDKDISLNSVDSSSLWLASGCWVTDDSSDLSSAGTIYLGGAQLQFKKGVTLENNFVLGASTTFTQNTFTALNYTALRVGQWQNANQTTKLTGEVDFREDTRVSFQNSNHLNLAGTLKGSGKVSLSSYDGTNTLTISGTTTNFTGVISLAEVQKGSVSLLLGNNAVQTGGLSGALAVSLASGTTASVLTLNVAAETALTYKGSMGAGISIVKSGEGNQTLSGQTLSSDVTVNAGSLTLTNITTTGDMEISGAGSLVITDTITNTGHLDLTATNISLGADLNSYKVKKDGSVTYSLDAEKENGFLIQQGAQLFLVKGTGTTVTQGAQVSKGGITYTLDADDTGIWFTSGDFTTSSFYISEGDVEVIGAGAENATGAEKYVLQGGTMQLTAGSLNASAIEYTSGGINMGANTSITHLTVANHGTLIGGISGSGTVEIASSDDYNTVIGCNAGFTGTTYITAGKFTINESTFGNTLKLASGTHMQLTGNYTFSKTMTLESGEHQLHTNGSNVFTVTGTVNGAGTLNKVAGGGLVVAADASVANLKASAGTTTVEGGSVANLTTAGGTSTVEGGSVTTLNASGGTTNVSGGSVTTLNASGGTTNVSGGSVATLSTTGGTTTVSGGSVRNLMSTGGTTNVTGTVSIGGGENLNGSHVNGIYVKDSGTVNIGNGTSTNTVTVTRVEMGDSESGNGGMLNVKSNATLVVTGGNVTTGDSPYHRTGLLLGEWGASSALTVDGTLLAQTASLFVGDNTANVVINNGGTMAVAGFGVCTKKDDKTQGINLTLNDGGKVVLGEAGINTSKPFSGVLGAGTVGISADTAITKNIALSSSTGTTFDTQKYEWGEGGASITQGTEGGTLSISGVVADHTDSTGKLVKDGAGTLELSGENTYSGGTEIKAGTVKTSNATALGTGAVSVAKDASLELGSSLTVSDLTIAEGGTLIFGNGAQLTATGSLTLGNISLDLTDYAAGSYTLVSATNGGSISWEKGSWTHNGTLGSDLVANVGFVGGDNKTLTLTIAKAETTVTTVVIEEKDGSFWYTLNDIGTSLTLNVEEGSLAGLLEGGLVKLELISEGMKQALLQDKRLTSDEVTLFLTDGKTTIEAGKDAIVGFYNEYHEGYWGKQVGSNRVYEIDRIPEPTTSALSLIGLAALAMRRRRK